MSMMVTEARGSDAFGELESGRPGPPPGNIGSGLEFLREEQVDEVSRI
jgi:hypothetical protein